MWNEEVFEICASNRKNSMGKVSSIESQTKGETIFAPILSCLERLLMSQISNYSPLSIEVSMFFLSDLPQSGAFPLRISSAVKNRPQNL
jgi:hypothetical protein